MKKNILLIAFIFLILLLDFAALDDITTGNESNFVGEYLTLLFSFPLLYFLVKKIRKIKTNK